MAMMHVRLEMGRTREHPAGSPGHGYILHVPLDRDGLIDVDGWKANREACTVTRFWAGEHDEHGHLVRTRGGRWAFSYEPGPDDDEPIFHLDNHPLKVGEYVTIRETDGEAIPFKVVSVRR